MLPRMLTAIFGALLVTLALLLFMNHAAKRFGEGEVMQYFEISDFIRAERPDWELPQAPPAPQRPPPRPELEPEPRARPELGEPVVIPPEAAQP